MKWFKCYRDNQEGVVAIEAAFFMLGFSMMTIALIDYATITTSSVELSNALRIGQQYALSYSGNTTGVTDAIKNGTTLDASSVTASASLSCECAGLTSACNASCSTNMAQFITMNVSYSVPLSLTYPGLSNPFPLSKTLTVRTQ
jgi:hypothetical protein